MNRQPPLDGGTDPEPTRRPSRGPLLVALVGIGCVACCALPLVGVVGVVAGAGNVLTGGPALATILVAAAVLAVTAFAWRRRSTTRCASDPACDADRGCGC